MSTDISENPRVAIGGNNPPLEERVIIDFDNALGEHDGLLGRLDEMSEKAAAAGPCTDEATAGRYGDFIKMTSTAVKVIEAEREAINRPLLVAQRSLKARADGYSMKASRAGAIVRDKLNAYLAEQENKRRAEAARIAEEQRQAEAERQRVIEEERIKAQQAAEAERKRLQDIADKEAADRRAYLQSIEDAKAADEQREAKAVEVEAEVVVVEPEPVFIPEAPQPVVVKPVASKGPIRGDYGTTVSAVETWDVKVVNIRQVPDLYLKHPSVIEALEKVIRPSVRGKNGLREIKGCEIFSTFGAAVR